MISDTQLIKRCVHARIREQGTLLKLKNRRLACRVWSSSFSIDICTICGVGSCNYDRATTLDLPFFPDNQNTWRNLLKRIEIYFLDHFHQCLIFFVSKSWEQVWCFENIVVTLHHHISCRKYYHYVHSMHISHQYILRNFIYPGKQTCRKVRLCSFLFVPMAPKALVIHISLNS